MPIRLTPTDTSDSVLFMGAKVPEQMEGYMDMRERAVRNVMEVLRHASDWQEGQNWLSENDYFHAWIEEEAPDNELSLCQSIVHEAEERLGAELPY